MWLSFWFSPLSRVCPACLVELETRQEVVFIGVTQEVSKAANWVPE